MGNNLKSRVPPPRRPAPERTQQLARCGGTGRLVENRYSDQTSPWGLYEQSGHAGFAVVICETPSATHVNLVTQWRPADSEAVEIPGGNIGQGDPDTLLRGLLQELREEVGELEIIEIVAADGFCHDIGREVVPEGGGKCAFPFVVRVRAMTPPDTHDPTDSVRKSRWYSTQQVREMVRDHTISDIVTCFFLLAAGVIESSDLGWTTIQLS